MGLCLTCDKSLLSYNAVLGRKSGTYIVATGGNREYYEHRDKAWC